MAITFPNQAFSLGRRHLNFSGEVGSAAGSFSCSIDRKGLAAYSRLDGYADDASIAAAFDLHRPLINAVAAAQWRAGHNRPKVTYEDLISFPADIGEPAY